MGRHLPSPRRPGRWLALLLSLSAASAQADVQAFWTAVEQAQARNPQVHKSEADLRAALEANPQSWARLMPSASLEARKSLWGKTKYRKLGVTSSDDSSSLGVIVNQPLVDVPGWLGVEQSQAHVSAAVAEMEGMRQEVTLAVANAAAEWLQAREVLKLAEDYRKVTARHLHVNRLRLNAGESTQTNVDEAASRAAQAEASYSAAKNTLDRSLAYFREVVGEDPNTRLSLPQLSLPLAADRSPRAMMEELQRLVEERPDVQAVRARIRESDQEEQMRRAEHLPTVDLTYEGSRTWNEELGGSSGVSRLDDVDEHSLMVVFSMPLFNGGDTVSRTREAKALKEGILAELDRVRNQAMREALDAYHDLSNSQNGITALEKALQASNSALSGMEEEFLVGTRTLLDLLDAQYEVFSVQTSLVRQRYQEQLARIRLWQAVGKSLLPETLSTWKPEPRKKDAAGVTEAYHRLDTMPEAWHSDWDDHAVSQSTPPSTLEKKGTTPAAAQPAQPATSMAPAQPVPPAITPAVATPAVSPAVATPAVSPAVATPIASPAVATPAVSPAVATPVVSPSTIPGFPAMTRGGPFFVRAGSYTNEAIMAETAGTLSRFNIDTSRETFRTPEGKEVVRLLIGPFKDHATTLQARDLIRQHTGIQAGWVRNPGAPGTAPTEPIKSAEAPPPADKGKRVRAMEDPSVKPMAKPAAKPAVRVSASQEAREEYPPIAHGPFLVHAGSFAKEEDSLAARQRMSAEKLPYWLEKSFAPDETPIYRLFSGPFTTLDHAMRAERILRDRVKLATGWMPNPLWEGHQPLQKE